MNTIQVKTAWASFFDMRLQMPMYIPKIQQDYPSVKNSCMQIGNEYPDAPEFHADAVLAQNGATFSDSITVQIICDDATLAQIKADPDYIIISG